MFSDPGSPSQNGRHERMHRDLKAECCSPGQVDLRTQNRSMNLFVKEYNEMRPHEALDMRTPAAVHDWSSRQYKQKVRAPEYGADMSVRKVSLSGALRWKSYEYLSICNALAGKYIGVKSLPNRVYEIYYRQECLGCFQEGSEVVNGRYYLLSSDRDLPERYRDTKARKRR
ncbi:integrase core domain-containing protein [Lewinella sp. 4G2]|uniref:integrase core domain-containing protein n=1 Tax=Lewinella sp. 4G2 TaxID=1803372 RepID=UPI000B001E3A